MYQNLKILLLCILIAMSSFYFINFYNQENHINTIKSEKKEYNSVKTLPNKFNFNENKIKPIDPVEKDLKQKPINQINTSQQKINIPDIKPITKDTNYLNNLKLKHNKNSIQNINTDNIKRQMIQEKKIIQNKLNNKFESFKTNLKPKMQNQKQSFLDFKNETIKESDKIKTSQ